MAEPVYDSHGILLLAAGETPQSERHVERILEIGFLAVAPTAPPPKGPELTLREGPECVISALRIASGTAVELDQAGTKRIRARCRYVGCLPRTAIYVGTVGPDGQSYSLDEKRRVAFSAIHGNEIVRFETAMLKQYFMPYPVAVLEYPAQVNVQRFRKHSRVTLNLQATVLNVGRAQTSPTPCRLTNISVGGLQFEVAANFAAIRESVLIEFALNGPAVRHRFKLMAAARSILRAESPGLALIGAEFVEPRPEETALLEHFVARQQMERLGVRETTAA